MIPLIAKHGGYRKTLTFAYACLVYHATEVFCARNYSYRNDPLGKTVGQMIGAARSARPNLVEGSSRAGTSKTTELRLYDVARGSLEELAGDYEAFLVGRGVAPWAAGDPSARGFRVLRLDFYGGDLGENARHEYAEYLMEMRRRFAPWLEAEDPLLAANGILAAIDRACALLSRQLSAAGEEFRALGGFTERMTAARLEHRNAEALAEDTPKCPKCGHSMHKVVAKKGRNASKPFWNCSAHPERGLLKTNGDRR